MSARTTWQKRADRFDCDLYLLLERAEKFEGDWDLDRSRPKRPEDVNPWREVAARLRSARRYVRDLMHEDDRKATT